MTARETRAQLLGAKSQNTVNVGSEENINFTSQSYIIINLICYVGIMVISSINKKNINQIKRKINYKSYKTNKSVLLYNIINVSNSISAHSSQINYYFN